MTKCLPPRAAYAVYSFKNGRRVEKARISTQDTRSHATLLACITGDAALQRHLPQFVLTNDATLSALEKDKLKYLPAPMAWVQNTKGWVTADILRGLLTELRRRVREHCPGKSLLVVWDAAPQHRQHSVLTHASRLGIHMVVIPAGTTWLLQPLDTHVFACFKRTLSRKQTESRAASADGVLPRGAWIDAAAGAISNVLVNRDWSAAMAANGLCDTGGSTRSSVQEYLAASGPLPTQPPSTDDLDMLAGTRGGSFGPMVLRPSLRVVAQAGAKPAGAPPIVPRAHRLLPPAPHAGCVRPRSGASSAGEAGPPVGVACTRAGIPYGR
jgi:hypothetical protein